MPGPDPEHWLHRLTAVEWLAAAHVELRHCKETLARRAVRPAVTHARRAAGMALNAILVSTPNENWGRSYMEHVIAIAKDDTVPAPIRDAARDLRDTPPAPPQLVQIGKADAHVLANAKAIVSWAETQVASED